MKRLCFLLFASITVWLSSFGQFNPLSVLQLQSQIHRAPQRVDVYPAPYIPALMLLDDESSSRADLEALGVIFYNERAGIHLTSIPRQAVGEVIEVPGIIDISCANTTSVCMNEARPFCFVDLVQTATPDRGAFTGKGVVTGISDIGFDPQHIAFKDNLKSFGNYRPEYNRSVVSQGDALATCTTDNPDQRHATHVANIMGGSWLEGLYYGVAPGSDLVVTTSALNDVGILLGVEHIIAYAKARDLRAVINLSLSNAMGPHDGTSLMSAYLNHAAQDAVICISSGNSGYCEGYAKYDFTPLSGTASVGLVSGKNYTLNNHLEFWSNSDRSFSVQAHVFDTTTGAVVYSSPFHAADNPEQEEFAPDMLKGKIVMLSYLCPMNNRYNLAVRLQYTTDEAGPDGRSARYVCFLTVKADPGVSVQGWTDNSPLMFADSPVKGESFTVQRDGTVNDLNTAPNVISVGSCRSRNVTPLLSGGQRTWPFDVGTISDWSSYASATDFCRALPDICSPGQMVVSAQSSYYMKDHTSSWNAAVTQTPQGDYYWSFDQGTSMSSPYVAGVFALWLEADPTLTVDDLRHIAASTARTDFPDFPSQQWGPGCIDAQEGLKVVLSGVSSIVEAEAGAEFPTAIYTLDGVRLPHNNPDALGRGVYILRSPSSTRVIMK